MLHICSRVGVVMGREPGWTLCEAHWPATLVVVLCVVETPTALAFKWNPGGLGVARDDLPRLLHSCLKPSADSVTAGCNFQLSVDTIGVDAAYAIACLHSSAWCSLVLTAIVDGRCCNDQKQQIEQNASTLLLISPLAWFHL